MTVFIYRELEFAKRLNQLSKAGGKGSHVAGRVEQVIQQAARNDLLRPEDLGRLTRYGEARIDKCMKMDMGGGYRLIYLRDGSKHIFLYLGTHDECDRWLKRNKGFEAFLADRKYKAICAREADRESQEDADQVAATENDNEEMFLENIDDKILRRVFCGLSGEQA